MARLLIHVEGHTEEIFVNEVLAPYLCRHGFERVGARLIGDAQLRSQRGGIRPWFAVRAHIIKHLRNDAAAIASTMVDYYGLPRTGERAWPGRDKAAKLRFDRKASTVESALHADFTAVMGKDFDPERFVPFVIMHEFEALLFSDCAAFSRGIGQPELGPRFQAIRDEFETPEEIDDSPVTAPSKRVESLIPNYEKPLLGNLAVLEIGLETILAQCPHFKDWLARLERAAVVSR